MAKKAAAKKKTGKARTTKKKVTTKDTANEAKRILAKAKDKVAEVAGTLFATVKSRMGSDKKKAATRKAKKKKPASKGV